MLVSFSVANFRSFGDEVTLKMVASNKLTNHPSHRVALANTGHDVLRSAVIYGANAAGKSNLVKAMQLAQTLICAGDAKPSISPFRFRRTVETEPSSFEFQFLADGIVYTYGFDVRDNTFSAEWLSAGKTGDDSPVFDRGERGLVVVHGSGARILDRNSVDTLTALASLPLRKDQLLLNRASALPETALGTSLGSIINWFSNSLVVLPANSRSPDLFKRLYEDIRFRKFCARFLDNIGTGVGNLDFVVTSREANEIERNYVSRYPQRMPRHWSGADDTEVVPSPDNPGVLEIRKLFAQHRVSPRMYSLPFAEESDGTRAILNLMPILAGKADDSHVFVIDELDRSLHPLICWEFIRFFSESCPGAHRQLIVTTHEAHLLNQDLLRRDEYWFAEKDRYQQTKLISLNKFKIRQDLKVEKGYLAGRFGAIPVIGGMHEIENLLECEEGEENAEEATDT